MTPSGLWEAHVVLFGGKARRPAGFRHVAIEHHGEDDFAIIEEQAS